ncbi:pumilio homolog 12 [Impatiens glandulifera]|uniref:pumilio homolog 12 n=1 Tax=Impatiens glandulifera TaxID=253017 RepID=UPI001FB09EAE|nr:pumilio homolog 12 [Impatiens glandulifera]
MDKGLMTEIEFDEIEKLLCEIPDATSLNLNYLDTELVNPSNGVSLCDDTLFDFGQNRPLSFIHEGKLSRGYKTQQQERRELPTEQSLAAAFEELNFYESTRRETLPAPSIDFRSFDTATIAEGRSHNWLKKPSSLNFYSQNYSYNGFEPKLGSHEELEKQQTIENYSASMEFTHHHGLQFLSCMPVHRTEPQPYFLDNQSPHLTWRHVNNGGCRTNQQFFCMQQQFCDQKMETRYPVRVMSQNFQQTTNQIMPIGPLDRNCWKRQNDRLTNEKSLDYSKTEQLSGRIYLMARDQHGCRSLQKKFTEGNREEIEKISAEVIIHIVELMTDPFGNYLVQKLLEVCTQDQQMQILHCITRNPGDLIRISCDMHGTRAVQKVIETLRTREQFSMVVSSLKPGIVTLMKNINGNHVAQRCLQYLTPEYIEFLFEAATSHCIELATDRHGCCVLQKCLSMSSGEQSAQLICEITSNTLLLSQDQFGNYVVQFILENRVVWATSYILDQLKGRYGCLSMQKYSSNVVEKCLKYTGEEHQASIIKELISNPHFDQIMQDPFGNYVIQAGLRNSEGEVHEKLMAALEPYIPMLRTSPFGKKILLCDGFRN